MKMRLLLIVLLSVATLARADEFPVAVAANFAAPAKLIAAEFEGLARLKDLPGQYYISLVLGMRHYANPQVTGAITAMREAGEEARRMLAHAAAFGKEMAELGFPQAQGAAANAPSTPCPCVARPSRGMRIDGDEVCPPKACAATTQVRAVE